MSFSHLRVWGNQESVNPTLKSRDYGISQYQNFRNKRWCDQKSYFFILFFENYFCDKYLKVLLEKLPLYSPFPPFNFTIYFSYFSVLFFFVVCLDILFVTFVLRLIKKKTFVIRTQNPESKMQNGKKKQMEKKARGYGGPANRRADIRIQRSLWPLRQTVPSQTFKKLKAIKIMWPI